MMRLFSRRSLMWTAASVAVVGGTSVWACGRRSDELALGDLDRFDIMKDSIIGAERVGLAMRQSFELEELEEQTITHKMMMTALFYECPTTRRGLLQNQVRTDFTNNDITLCDRFVVSKTESLIAGLRYDAWRVENLSESGHQNT